MGEVLVRLREEERALLPPGDFFPLFEHYRMMPQLDRWVVRHTIKRLAAGIRLPRLTVNLSWQTLDDAGFFGFVANELAMRGVSPGVLLFEVDEADTLMRLEAVLRFARAYRGIGGALMVDGFGRRSASFSAIDQLRADFVKVDGIITRKLLTSEAARRKMNALLTISRALRFALVGEFVEDQDILIRLKALGVAYAQGFGVYQPQSLESFVVASN